MITRVVPISDTHSGLRVSLMLKKWVTGEGDQAITHKPNRTQKWVHKLWQKKHDIVFDGTADEVVLALMGDAIHGHNRVNEVWTTSLFSQADHYIECLLPWVNKASETYSIAGTRWHVDIGGDNIEDYIARELGVYRKKSFDKMEVEIDGVRFMLQHKGPKPGTRAWTRENSMLYMLRSIAFRNMQRGTEPADVYLWGHFHEYLPGVATVELPGGFKEIRGYVLPSWCTPNEYALSNVKDLELADVGGIYFDIVDGVLQEPTLMFERFDAVPRVKHGS